MINIRQWLEQHGLGKYASVFAANDIGVDVLHRLTEAHLERLGVSLGDQVRLQAAVAQLHETAAPAGETLPRTASSGDAERRQLSVMFCDLAGSTELSITLDPEDLREVNLAYQDVTKRTIERHGGYVARYMGDGVLAYFGYPVAREDDAERAVLAGLELTRAVPNCTANMVLSVRVGVATGAVVVGDVIGEGASQESAVVGETPNLAARLQALAVPNTVVVSAATRALVAGFFECEYLGAQALKGFVESQSVWRVIEETRTESRFEALHRDRLSGFVGRRSELRLLHERWEAACGGEGQVVLLCGEPGIGKSRLAAQLAHTIIAQAQLRLRFQCSPQHTNSAYYPFIAQLQRAARFERGDAIESRLDKLEAVVAASGETREQALTLLASLLSLPTTRYPPLDLSPNRRKAATMQALVGEFETLCEAGPVLGVFEDVHWIDPTSGEVLDSLVEAVHRSPALIVITHRPEFISAWRAHGHVTELSLNRLPVRERASIVREVAGGKRLPGKIEQQILETSDGVPLFVEELTRSALTGQLVKEESTHYVLESVTSELAIPSTLHGSLMARLDRNAAAKELAQIGACIGREFSYELVKKVADEVSDLSEGLETLEADQIIFRRGLPPQATYSFKHALVQGVAYDSLLRKNRRRVHARIAAVLEESFPDIVEQQPEVVALHAAEGGLFEAGARYRLAAAARASERSAAADVVAHLSEALRLVGLCPAGEDSDRQALEILVRLGTALAVSKGFSAGEVEETYRKARSLAERLGDRQKLFAATWGLWLINQTRARYTEGRQLADELLTIGRADNDAAVMLEAHHASWTTLASVPDLAACLAHAERGISLYDPVKHRDHKFIYAGHDPGVCARSHLALTSWLLGYPERARSEVRSALALAEEIRHGPSLVAAYVFAAWVYQFAGDPSRAREHADAAIALSEEQNLSPQHASVGRVVRGWALVAEGDVDAGLSTAWQGMDELETLKYRVRRPYLLGVIADACLRAGRIETGLEAARESLIQSGGMWSAEVQRLEGELTLAAPQVDAVSAEASLCKAHDLAEHQGARSLQLRAATSLARLYRRQGRTQDALNMLAPVYGQFTEGFDTTDLVQARTLMRAAS